MEITNWTTYDGRVASMEDMDHQHMSNIHHFINIVHPDFYPNSVKDEILRWLVQRFAGLILPYHPDPNFNSERVILRSKGYLQPNNDIVVNGEKVGCYE